MDLSSAALFFIEPPAGLFVVALISLLFLSTPALAQSADQLMVMRRCSGELNVVMSRDIGGRNPQAVMEEPQMKVRQTSSNQFDVSGPGRYTREPNDRGRPFTYRCTVEIRSGRVNAHYQWSGGGFDNGYNRPAAPPPPSSGNGGGVGFAPQGRIWASGGIISRASSKGLDVQDRSTSDGANVQQWEYGGNPNQSWDIVDLGRGEYAIVSEGSTKVLDVMGHSRQDGGDVIQFRWNGGSNQRWRFEQTANGFFQIVNVGSGKCLDVRDKRADNGANIEQWSCSGATNQSWRIQPK
jgi:hypothetical protein